MYISTRNSCRRGRCFWRDSRAASRQATAWSPRPRASGNLLASSAPRSQRTGPVPARTASHCAPAPVAPPRSRRAVPALAPLSPGCPARLRRIGAFHGGDAFLRNRESLGEIGGSVGSSTPDTPSWCQVPGVRCRVIRHPTPGPRHSAPMVLRSRGSWESRPPPAFQTRTTSSRDVARKRNTEASRETVPRFCVTPFVLRSCATVQRDALFLFSRRKRRSHL